MSENRKRRFEGDALTAALIAINSAPRREAGEDEMDEPDFVIRKRIFDSGHAVVAARDCFIFHSYTAAECERFGEAFKPLVSYICNNRNMTLVRFTAKRVHGTPMPTSADIAVMVLYDLSVRTGRDEQKRIRPSPGELLRQLESEPHVVLVRASFVPHMSAVYLIQRSLAPWIIGGLAARFAGPLQMPEVLEPMFLLAECARGEYLLHLHNTRVSGVRVAFVEAALDMQLIERLAALRWLFFDKRLAENLLSELKKPDEYLAADLKRIEAYASVVRDSMPARTQQAPGGGDDGDDNCGIGGAGGAAEYAVLSDPDDEIKCAALVNTTGHWRGSQRHEYWHRLSAPGANDLLRISWGYIVSLAYHIFHRFSHYRQDRVFFQTWLHVAHQLMRCEIDRNHVEVMASSRAWDWLRPEQVADAPDIAQPRLLHIAKDADEVVRNVPQAFAGIDGAAEHLALCVYKTLYGYSRAQIDLRESFERFDIAMLVANDQQSNTHYLVRHHSAVPVVSAAISDRAWFDGYLRKTGQLMVAQRIDAARAAAGAGVEELVLRLPLNCRRGEIGTRPVDPPRQWRHDTELSERFHQRIANALTPQAVQSSIMALLPHARDGVDFFVCYSPLSFTPALPSETRGRTANAAFVAKQSWSAVKHRGGEPLPTTHARGRPPKRRSVDTEPLRSALDDRQSAPSADGLTRPIADASIVVWLSDRGMARALGSGVASTVLWRRVSGTAERVAHMPLVGPAVARLLAEETAPGPLCQALNAISGMFGLSLTEWDSETFRGTVVAERAARLVAPVLDIYARACGGAFTGGGAYFMRTSTLESWEIDRSFKTDMPRARTAAKQRNTLSGAVGSALSVLLNAATLPVTCDVDAFEWLSDVVFAADVDDDDDEEDSSSSRKIAIAKHLADMARLMRERRLDERWQKPMLACARGKSEQWQVRKRLKPSDVPQNAEEWLDDALRAFSERPPDECRAGARKQDQEFYPRLARVCRCGAATIETCTRMARAMAVRDYYDWMCCLCAEGSGVGEDAEDASELSNLSLRFMHRHCSSCRARVCWRHHDADELMMPNNVQLFEPVPACAADGSIDAVSDYQAAMVDDNYISPYTIIEGVIEFVRAGGYDQDDVVAAARFFDSLRFRIFRYCTAPPVPTQNQPHSERDAEHFYKMAGRFGDIAAKQVQKSGGAPLSAADRARVEASWEMTAEKIYGVPVGNTTATLSRSLLRDGLLADNDDDDDELQQPTDAAAVWLASMEMAQIQPLENVAFLADGVFLTRKLAEPQMAAVKESALIETWRFFVAPIAPDARSLHRYQRQLAALVTNGANYFPLCASVLAESTALGAAGASSVMSEDRRDLASKLSDILYNSCGAVPRPLATALPLLAELSFINAYQ